MSIRRAAFSDLAAGGYAGNKGLTGLHLNSSPLRLQSSSRVYKGSPGNKMSGSFATDLLRFCREKIANTRA